LDQNAIQALRAQLRERLSIATPERRPEKLIRLSILWGAGSNATADEVTGVMMELREEFDISEAAIHQAIEDSQLLSEVWPIY
jgi:hypothetical protein